MGDYVFIDLAPAMALWARIMFDGVPRPDCA